MIQFKEVTKKYSDKTAIDSVSFCIESGTACGYIGPNGAGKTTTAKIIVGLEKPDSGEIKVSPNIGYVPESPRFYESLTPVETIAMASLLRKFSNKEAIKKLDVLSEIFAFKEHLKKPIRTLSKGTRQKVAISLALIFNPEILVLDEPTDGLDVQAVVNLKKLIKSFTAHGGAVFYSSHLLDIVESVCDKAYLINQGRLAGEYTRSDFLARRGFLEEVFMEHLDMQNHLVDAFFENKI